jgi:hypothetical protein
VPDKHHVPHFFLGKIRVRDGCGRKDLLLRYTKRLPLPCVPRAFESGYPSLRCSAKILSYVWRGVLAIEPHARYTSGELTCFMLTATTTTKHVEGRTFGCVR